MTEARASHDPKDLRAAADLVATFAPDRYKGLADRLEAWADDMERLAPLEAVVLDALSEADIRTGAESTYWRAHYHAHNGDDTRAAALIAAADALSDAADALAALREAQQ